MTVPLCTGCKSFGGMNGRDECLRYGSWDAVRGWRPRPRIAFNERSGRLLWFGKNRCGPEGQHFEERPPMPPPPGSDDR